MLVPFYFCFLVSRLVTAEFYMDAQSLIDHGRETVLCIIKLPDVWIRCDRIKKGKDVKLCFRLVNRHHCSDRICVLPGKCADLAIHCFARRRFKMLYHGAVSGWRWLIPDKLPVSKHRRCHALQIDLCFLTLEQWNIGMIIAVRTALCGRICLRQIVLPVRCQLIRKVCSHPDIIKCGIKRIG